MSYPQSSASQQKIFDTITDLGQLQEKLKKLQGVVTPVTPNKEMTLAGGIVQQAAAQTGGGQPQPQPQPAAPPQPGIAGLAKNAAIGANIQDQQQQDAQKQMMQMAQAQQAQQAQQPVMAAEGGIASLPVSNDDYEYADGGIIGYDDGGYVDPMGGVSGAGGGASGDIGILDAILSAIGAGNPANRQAVEELREIEKKKARVTEQYAPPKFDISGDPSGAIRQLNAALATADPRDKAAIQEELLKQYARQSSMPSGAPSAPAAPAFTMPADPTFAESAKEVRKEFPGADRTEAERLYERQKELAESRPDFEATGIENALRKYETEKKAAQEYKSTESRRRLEAWLEGAASSPRLGSAGAAAGKFDVAARAEATKERELDQLRDAAVLNLQMQKHAAAVNDVGALAKLRNDMDKITEESQRVQATVAGGLQAAKLSSGARETAAMLQAMSKGSGVKPPPGMNFADMERLQGMVDAAIPAANPLQSQFFVEYVSKYVPNGKQLLQDMQDPGWFGSARAKKEDIADAVRQAQQAYREKLLKQSKFGASAAAGATSYDDAMRDLEAS